MVRHKFQKEVQPFGCERKEGYKRPLLEELDDPPALSPTYPASVTLLMQTFKEVKKTILAMLDYLSSINTHPVKCIIQNLQTENNTIKFSWYAHPHRFQ